ncbi:MAG: hypothetical protein WDO74_09915 [Pseudomonadota bacterium]
METAEIPAISPKPAAYPLVFMRFRPAWAYIDGIREFGRFFCQTTFGTQELADRACVVLQETLENAVKYSSNLPDSELELSIESDGSKIEFSVSSLPEASHLSCLREELSGIHTLDPEQAYLAAFIRASSEPESSARLGLARIRYEGGVELSMREESGGRIRITATGKL